MSLSDDVDLEELVMTKDDLSGADIKAVCTEAGLLALRERRMRVTKADFTEAREKVRVHVTRDDFGFRSTDVCVFFICRFCIGRMRVHRKDCIYSCRLFFPSYFSLLLFGIFFPDLALGPILLPRL